MSIKVDIYCIHNFIHNAVALITPHVLTHPAPLYWGSRTGIFERGISCLPKQESFFFAPLFFGDRSSLVNAPLFFGDRSFLVKTKWREAGPL
jgi:hypothetical protein